MTHKLRWVKFFNLALILGISYVFAQTHKDDDTFAPSSTGLRQLAQIKTKLSKSFNDLPLQMERIAVSQIKTSPRDFTPGMARYIQSLVEETFRHEAHRIVITSPELKTFRIISTDSSFKFTNTTPTNDELAKLAEKLRVDGFIEGSCYKTEDNDVILNLKLYRPTTGEIMWSGSYIAGPNETKPEGEDVDWSVSASMRYFPIKQGIIPRTNNLSVLDTLTTLGLTQYSIEGAISEPVTSGKWLTFSVILGFSSLTGSGGPDSLSVNFNMQMAKFGVEALGIFFRKANPEMGYWLGTYVGVHELIPFLERGNLTLINLGYKSRVSRHFTLGGGINIFPFNNKLKGLTTNEKRSLTLEPVGYEITFLHYTF